MSERLDVRRMLLRRGWTEDHEGFLWRNGAMWTALNAAGDSGVTARERAYDIQFNGDVPARIITAIAETIANDRPKGPTQPA
jgi:hypothetical protein